jgi:hypothetical protein
MRLKYNIGLGFLTILLLAILMGIVGSLGGCTSTRKSQEQTTVNINEQIKEKDSMIATLQRVISEQEREIRELRYSGVTFQDRCDTSMLRAMLTAGLVESSVIDQYLKRLSECSDEVEIAADGTIKAKGALKDAFVKQDLYKREINRLTIENDSLKRVKAKESTRDVEVVKWKTETKKITVFPWYFWLITAAFGVMWLRKQFYK